MLALLQKLLDFTYGCFKTSPDRTQYFDEDLSRDQWDLLEAAGMLQITEFRVFELAYKDWYGVAPKVQVIEVHFRNYMFNQLIPAWVAHFCRRIVELGRDGSLNPRDFGVYQRLPSRRMMRIGQAYTAMLLVSFLILLYMAYGNALIPDTVQSLFGRADQMPAGYDLPQNNAMP